MIIKQIMKDFYRKHASFFNRLPMINQVKNRGKNNIFKLDKPVIRSKIVCVGNNNKIALLPGGGLDKCNFVITGDNNTISIGQNSSVINGTFYIEESNNNIIIANECSLCGEVLLAACEGTDIIIDDGALFSSHIAAGHRTLCVMAN